MTRYIGKQPAFGNFVKLDAISVVNGQAAYTMQNGGSNFTNYDNVNQFIVSLNGLIQAPTDSFTVSGSTITFASALSTGDVINFILVLGDVLSVGTPSDNTVSTVKIQNTAVNADKLATDAVQTAKIQNDAVTTDKINLISTSSTPSLEAKGTSGQTDGYIQLNCEQNSHGIKLKSPPHSAGQSYTLTFPSTAPATDKILQTNSSGVLSFVDAPSGSHTLISTTNITSPVSSFDLTNIFTDTYRDYLVVCSAMHPATQDSVFHVRFYNSSGEITSTYRYINMARADDGATPNSNSTNDSEGRIFNSRGVGAGSQNAFNVKGTLFFPKNSNHFTHFDYQASCHNSNDGKNFSEVGSITYEGTDEIVGIRFKMSAGNIDTGNIKIYGIS